MRRQKNAPSVIVAALATSLFAGTARAQSSDSHVGVSVKASTLGVAIEAAVPVADRVNVRGGFNVFNYDHQFESDGRTFDATLKMQSVDLFLDWFPFGGGFHVSPGVLVYNGNKVSGTESVPANKQFSLNDVEYISNPANPVTGSAAVTLGKAGPALLVGWGNLVPRGSRRWSIPFEMGIVYIQSPTLALNLNGSACALNGTNCRPIATDPTLQANVAAEQKKGNDDLSPLKVYPVISLGFAYKF